MFGEKNQYNNVIVFPTGKPFTGNKNDELIEKVRNFNDYIVAVELMVKKFKLTNKVNKNEKIEEE